ncbi:DUF6082 family protein [Streptomyces sp. NPDC059690]|uniref:DUF6082 family protein n=1 Tax=Streptomyces sp. NPDC059690 TaxID=3346907 RepID=UPI0036B75F3F
MTGIIVLACLASIALTLALVRIPGLQTSQSGNAGQAFGAAPGATSIIVLVYVARSFNRQREETRMQREFLQAQQSELLAQKQAELVALREDARISNECALKVAETAIRGQHHSLITAAIADPLLADVWPSFGPDVSHETRKQFFYANQIISFECMAYTLGVFNCDEAEEMMYHLFQSALLRSFWEQTRIGRNQATPHGGKMQKFYEVAELAFQRRVAE